MLRDAAEGEVRLRKCPMRQLKHLAAQGRKDSGKSFGRDSCRSRHDGARLLSGVSGDSTTRCVRRPRGKTRNRIRANAAEVRGVSCHRDYVAFRAFSSEAQKFLLLDFEHEFDGFSQAGETLGLRPALTVGTWNLWTVSDEPLAVSLHQSRKMPGGSLRPSCLSHASILSNARVSRKPCRSAILQPA